jgi:hypothetical protein
MLVFAEVWAARRGSWLAGAMTRVCPGDGALQARALLRTDARRIVEPEFRIDMRGVDKAVGAGVGRVQGVIGPQALGDAGWGLLFIGALMLRDDSSVVSSAVGDDRLFVAGLSYGAFVAASAGDVLLGRSETAGSAEAVGIRWTPSSDADAALPTASRLSADVVASESNLYSSSRRHRDRA